MSDSLLPIVKSAASVADVSTPFGRAVSNTLADVWQGIIGDKVAAWRLTNAAKISDKLSSEIAKSGQQLDMSRIPDSFAFSWFEEATRQDQPEIQDLFAKLLLNAVDGNAEALERRNVEIVSRMAPEDAKALEQIGKEIKEQLQQADVKGRKLSVEWSADYISTLKNFVGGGIISSMLAMENLTNLGVVTENANFYLDSDEVMKRLGPYIANHTQMFPPEFDSALREDITFNLTLTGASLLKALDKEFIGVPSTRD